jgi:hypothetical protein
MIRIPKVTMTMRELDRISHDRVAHHQATYPLHPRELSQPRVVCSTLSAKNFNLACSTRLKPSIIEHLHFGRQIGHHRPDRSNGAGGIGVNCTLLRSRPLPAARRASIHNLA